jgi:hypothetical protein
MTRAACEVSPPSVRGISVGLGQQEVLDARQVVGDIAVTVQALDAVFEIGTQTPSNASSGTRAVFLEPCPLRSARPSRP